MPLVSRCRCLSFVLLLFLDLSIAGTAGAQATNTGVTRPRSIIDQVMGRVGQAKTQDWGSALVTVEGAAVDVASGVPVFRVTIRNSGTGSTLPDERVVVRSLANAWTPLEAPLANLRVGQSREVRLGGNFSLSPGGYDYVVELLDRIDRQYRESFKASFAVAAPPPTPPPTAWPTPTPTEWPTPQESRFDAAVAFVTHEARADKPSYFRLRISNHGPDVMPAASVRLRVDGTAEASAPVATLPAGGSVELVLVTTSKLSPGNHVAEARILRGQGVSSTDWPDASAANNVTRLDVFVPGGPPPPSPPAFPWVWLVVLASPLALFNYSLRQRLRRALRIPPRVILVPTLEGASVRAEDDGIPDRGWEIEITPVIGRPRVWVQEAASTTAGGAS